MCDCSSDFSTYMRHRDQVDQHLFDPEPERTLHRTRREQNRNLADMENNEEQNLAIERKNHREAEMGITAGLMHPGRLYSQMILLCC